MMIEVQRNHFHVQFLVPKLSAVAFWALHAKTSHKKYENVHQCMGGTCEVLP